MGFNRRLRDSKWSISEDGSERTWGGGSKSHFPVKFSLIHISQLFLTGSVSQLWNWKFQIRWFIYVVIERNAIPSIGLFSYRYTVWCHKLKNVSIRAARASHGVLIPRYEVLWISINVQNKVKYYLFVLYGTRVW
jgi:hypothetical protein